MKGERSNVKREWSMVNGEELYLPNENLLSGADFSAALRLMAAIKITVIDH